MHVHLLFEWKSTAISISALEIRLNYSGLFGAGDRRSEKRHLINASMFFAHDGKKRSIISTNLYLR